MEKTKEKAKEKTKEEKIREAIGKVAGEMLNAQHEQLTTKLYIDTDKCTAWTITEADSNTYQDYHDDKIIIADTAGGVYCDCEICREGRKVTDCDDYPEWESDYVDDIMTRITPEI